jgi:hypothetical protein
MHLYQVSSYTYSRHTITAGNCINNLRILVYSLKCKLPNRADKNTKILPPTTYDKIGHVSNLLFAVYLRYASLRCGTLYVKLILFSKYQTCLLYEYVSLFPYTAEFGYSDLGLCDTSAIASYSVVPTTCLQGTCFSALLSTKY